MPCVPPRVPHAEAPRAPGARPSHRARWGVLAATLLATLTAAAACRRPTDRRSFVEQAVALAPAVERATGLRFKSPAKVEVRTAEQVKAFVAGALDTPGAREELAGQAAAFKMLGVLPDTLDLRALMERVLAEQIVGYYDPKTKTLYVVQAADSAAADVTLRHELVHALQDQYLNLDSLQRVFGNADRQIAVQAALEGQATYVQFAGDIAARLPGGWDRIRQGIRENMDRMPVLATAPFIVKEELLFPYLSGAELARRVSDRGGDSLLRRLPASTEQVLHADRYVGSDSAKPDAPVVVTLPPPRVGTVTAQNTLGEFDTRLVLYHHLQNLDVAAQAARGWAGDRWAIVRTPAGDAFVWVSVWDTPTDAAEAYDTFGQMVPARWPDAALVPAPAAKGAAAAPQTARTWTVPGAGQRAPRQLAVRAADVQGRQVVLFVDAPAGAGADLVDLSRVTFSQ